MRQCALLEDSSCGKSHNSVKRTKSNGKRAAIHSMLCVIIIIIIEGFNKTNYLFDERHCWVTIYIRRGMCLYECVLKSYEIKLMIHIDSFFEKSFFKLNVCSLLNQSVLILSDLIEEKYVVLSKHSK